jgi:hypothetical protein
MAVEEFYFKELQKILVEIRDEMRALREVLEPLAYPQHIVFNAEPPSSSSSFVELQAYFDEWAKKSYGS